jgi:hypothetical protein
MSVVAIPTPSFAYWAESSTHNRFESLFPSLPRNVQPSGLKKENIKLYGGSGAMSRQIARLGREEPALEREGSLSGILP